ncbi:hypothetical protein [uncultured Sunxiuqinia sp.]|uniref:hypothetical protein n=1 Tax=uncultured Sunxiuqinia sp. TaxID=1573825 RepID=UPI002AA70B7F|nr:hypothetical protein [uncultured Sunxiuqinia sp.]
MRQIYFAAILALLITSVTIGQDKKLPDYKFQTKTKIEKEGKNFATPKLRKAIPELKFENNKPGDQEAVIKSALDTKQQLDSIVWYSWDDDADQKYVSFKYLMEYNEKGSRILQANYKLDKPSNTWIFYSKYEYEYNNGRELILEKFSELNESTSKWGNTWKQEYGYTNGNLTQESYFRWNVDTDEWEGE